VHRTSPEHESVSKTNVLDDATAEAYRYLLHNGQDDRSPEGFCGIVGMKKRRLVSFSTSMIHRKRESLTRMIQRTR
jgi:hypothetical protein